MLYSCYPGAFVRGVLHKLKGFCMPKNVFAVVAEVFQSIETAVVVANAFDKAYHDSVGQPDGYVPFTAETNPQLVAMNQAGLYAADTAAHMLAINYQDEITEENYVDALQQIASGSQIGTDYTLICLAANLAWRAGQPFRDMATKPFNRMGRAVNQPWASLSDEEKTKDFVQVQLGAQLLLSHIDSRS